MTLKRIELFIKVFIAWGILLTITLCMNFYFLERLITLVEHLQDDVGHFQDDLKMLASPGEDCPHIDLGQV